MRKLFKPAVWCALTGALAVAAHAQFAQQAKLVGTGGGTGSTQGWSVATSTDGNTAIIGGQFDVSGKGAAWIFTRSNGVWTQVGNKLVAGVGANPLFGSSVALSSDGTTAAIGAGSDASGGTGVGAVYVFTLISGVWTQQGGALFGTPHGTTSHQGTRVALSADGNTLASGGPTDAGNNGAVWVFTRSGGVWTQTPGKLTDSTSIGSKQGTSLALSGDGKTLAWGGNADTGNTGAVWVYTVSGGVWSQQQKFAGTGANGSAEQGGSVALSSDGNTLLEGGFADNGNTGAFWVFTRSGTLWTQQGNKLLANDSAGAAEVGLSVALSSDGNTAMIGGPDDNSVESGFSGAAWIFTRSGGVWTQQGSKLTSTPLDIPANLGFSVALSGDGYTALAGGPADTNTNLGFNNYGATWVFYNPKPGTTTLGSSNNPSTVGQSVTFTATVPQGATGTVTFSDNGQSLGSPVTVSNSQALFTTSNLTVGSHTITAAYSGDPTFAHGTGTLTQTVNAKAGTTTLSSSVNPSTVGQSVTFTATVPQGASGTVTFSVDGQPQGSPVTVSNSQAQFTTSTLTLGSHTILAAYNGDSNFAPGSANLTQAVISPGTIGLLSSSNPSVVGVAVTFTAVAPQGATGTVTFSIDSVVQQPPVTLVNHQAQFTTSTLTVGTHTILAAYGGDSNFAPSSSSLSQLVTTKSGTITVSSSLNPSVVGQVVTFTATVPTGATGTVTFSIDNVAQQPPVTVSNNQAQFSTTALAAGARIILASYSGDSNFGPGTALLIQTVNLKPGTTTLTTSTNPSVPGQTVTFTATVPGGATGTVVFSIDGTPQPPAPVAGSTALFATASLALGTHAIVATYSGDANFSPGSGNLTQTVSAELSLSSSANPSPHGRAVTFTAIVPQSATGSILFTIDGIPQPQTFPAPVAQFTTSTLTVGSHTTGASYSGDANFPPTAGSLTQVVVLTPPVITFTSSADPSVVGQPVTFTATLNLDVGVSLNGLVMIVLDGSTPLGTATVSGSSASFTTQALTAGSHVIVAKFVGVEFQVTLGQVVYGMTSTTTVSVTPAAPVAGLPVTLVATMGPATPPSGFKPPTGQVMFEDNGLPVGTSTILAGTATLTLPSLPAGTHQITGVYLGDKSWNSSFGRVTVTVAPAGP